MKIKFLGTGTSQGVPVIGCTCAVCVSQDTKNKRLRSSALIKISNKNILIDTGPDLRQQALKNKINKIDYVLYTHAHRDHVSGIDELRSFNFIQKKSIKAYGNKELVNQLKNDYSYIFSDFKYPGLPEVELNKVNKNFYLDDIEIIPIKVKHHKLNILGYRIGNLTYITDAKTISDNQLKKINGSQILVINCLQIKEHLSHLNMEEVLSLIRKIEVKKVYLIHISHNLGLHDEINKSLPDNVELAYDNLEIIL
ncbi:MAG: MBL fold metallo-hydrolase [Flammeovirgaceae bacterium]|nr:MBL fold metallo-hydrolase [Flammeovirgaceae bacterium]